MPILKLDEHGYIILSDKEQDILARVCRAMDQVKAVEKRDEAPKAVGGYAYASADDVYDSVRKILAKNRLAPQQDELECQIERVEGKDGKMVAYLRLRYSIGFIGERPVNRSIMLQYNGPQSFQAAATYVLKYWLRGRLLLSTGEGDLDTYETESQASQGQSLPQELHRADEEQPTLPMTQDRAEWAREIASVLGPKDAKVIAKVLGEIGKHPSTLEEDDIVAALSSLTEEEAKKVEHVLAGKD